MEWISEGYEVIDLGKNVSPNELVEAIEYHGLDVIGISCMRDEFLQYFEAFLEQLQTKDCKVRSLIGEWL